MRRHRIFDEVANELVLSSQHFPEYRIDSEPADSPASILCSDLRVRGNQGRGARASV